MPSLVACAAERRDSIFRVESSSTPPALARARIRYDRYRCVTCGFTTAKYQMIWQYGHSPRELSDLRTLCRACWQVMNLEAALVARSARLAWIPELTQIELNRGMPKIYVARISSGPQSPLARQLLDVIVRRTELVPVQTGLRDLEDLVLELQAADGQPEVQARLLSNFGAGLRVLPLDRWIVREGDLEFNQYPQMLAYWRSAKGPLHGSHSHFATLAQDWFPRLGAKADQTASS